MENYRPRHIDDFCLEPDFKQHIRFLLDNHCDFLLSGPRGCGKTTLVTVHIQEHIARIGNPKSVMVLNNLRDQSINFYRNELKFFCQFPAPSQTKKILFVDDIHTLEKSNQLLLKSYRERWHKNFTLIATTNNINKVVDNLKSCLFPISFTPRTPETLTRFVKTVLQTEAIECDLAVIEYIIAKSDQSIRVLLNLLLKFKLLDQRITPAVAAENCNIISQDNFEDLIGRLRQNDVNAALALLQEFLDKGYSNSDILDEFFHYTKQMRLLSDDEKYKIIELINKYVIVFNTIHEENIELALLANACAKVLA